MIISDDTPIKAINYNSEFVVGIIIVIVMIITIIVMIITIIVTPRASL